MSRVGEAARHAGRLSASRFVAVIVLALAVLNSSARGQQAYHVYFGNTHAHTFCSDGKETASDHFSKAKAAGYDFYAVTDHALAKHPNFTPQSYEDTKRAANECTDAKFVAIAGFEFSENDGPGGTGHLNALNTSGYLDATGPNVNLPVFYDWLVKNHTPTTAASFNHAGTRTYNGYDYLTPARRDEITMFEVINGGKLLYQGFLVALDKGWRVAPIAAEDGHGTWLITHHHYRTGVLAPSLTRDDIMQAMRARRVYCTWDKNLKLSFQANGKIMGSVLQNPASIDFSITVSDADTLVTRIEIVDDAGAVVRSKDFSDHSVAWNVTCAPQSNCYFLKVYTAERVGPETYAKEASKSQPRSAKAKAKAKGAAPSTTAASQSAPTTSQQAVENATAYSAPVWVERPNK